MNYKKVNKPTARKLYYEGISIYLIPCKVSEVCLDDTQKTWVKPCIINMFTTDESENKFDRAVNNFEYYNCNAELGYYARYYVTEEDLEKSSMCDLMCGGKK